MELLYVSVSSSDSLKVFFFLLFPDMSTSDDEDNASIDSGRMVGQAMCALSKYLDEASSTDEFTARVNSLNTHVSAQVFLQAFSLLTGPCTYDITHTVWYIGRNFLSVQLYVGLGGLPMYFWYITLNVCFA